MASRQLKGRLERLEASVGLSGGNGGDKGDRYYNELARTLRAMGYPGPCWANLQRAYDRGDPEIVALFDGGEVASMETAHD